MEIICISDNIETAVGLRLSGINTIFTTEREEAMEVINNSLKEKSVGIIAVTENIYKLIKNDVDNIRENYNLPLIISIP